MRYTSNTGVFTSLDFDAMVRYQELSEKGRKAKANFKKKPFYLEMAEREKDVPVQDNNGSMD